MKRAMTVVRLTALMVRPAGAGVATIALPVVAFAIATGLLSIVMAGAIAIFQWTGADVDKYRAMALVALVLLVVPLIALGASASRLSARRRDERLATLRLLGAGARLVTAVTVAESTFYAMIGAVFGTVLYCASVPLMGMLSLRGHEIGAASLWLDPRLTAAVIVGVTCVAWASSAVGIRSVVLSPLGVMARSSAPRLGWIRFLVAVVIAVAALYVTLSLDATGNVTITAVILGGVFAAMLGVVSLLGPFVIRLLASVETRLADGPIRLLAARRILDDPKGSWRSVSGVAMMSFVAVIGGLAASLSAVAEQSGSRLLAIDIQTGVTLTLVLSYVAVGCSVGVNQAADILDRRRISVGLDMLGARRSVLERARYRSVMLPLGVATVVPALIAFTVMTPVAGTAMLSSPEFLVNLAAGIVGGLGLVALALVATRPVATSVLRAGQAHA